jgi:hypothetical protein
MSHRLVAGLQRSNRAEGSTAGSSGRGFGEGQGIVAPGRLLPARELLGDMLMELKRSAEALKEYEASHQREPNRYRGLYGAGRHSR